MTTWRRRKAEALAAPAPQAPASFTGPAKYRALHKYLDGRYATSVVLTFAQIEDILGSVLPDVARLRREWWANADEHQTPSAHARSWTEASRTATPNLQAKFVVFERGA